jgi:nucleotide-binding universal stress UspA family protein
MKRTIILATHGQAAAAGALRVTAALAPRLRATVEVITVLDPIPTHDYGFAPVLIPDASMEQERVAAHMERIREQLRTVVGSAAQAWSISCHIGFPADVIAGATRAPGVLMAVMGLGRHAPADRIFGGETALRVSRLAPVPLLAVADDADGLPCHVLIATDFSPSSVRAARAAMPLLDPCARITIAHAMPDVDLPDAGRGDWERVYRRGVDASIAGLKAELDAPPEVRFDAVVLRGEPAEELVMLAQHTPVDLIVAGSHGRSAFQRLFLGSVATKLLRASQCSVLLAPAEGIAEAVTDGAAEAARQARSARALGNPHSTPAAPAASPS